MKKPNNSWELLQTWSFTTSMTPVVQWNSTELGVVQFRWHDQFHGIPWCFSCHRKLEILSAVDLSRTLSKYNNQTSPCKSTELGVGQFRWHEQFDGISWTSGSWTNGACQTLMVYSNCYFNYKKYLQIYFILSTDFAFRITDWTCCHGSRLHAILRIISRGVSGLATDSPCGVWGRGWTTCLLHDIPFFGSHFKMRVGMWVLSDI